MYKSHLKTVMFVKINFKRLYQLIIIEGGNGMFMLIASSFYKANNHLRHHRLNKDESGR